MPEKQTPKKRSITGFFLGHEKPNKADIIELLIALVFLAYIAFYLLKTQEII